MLAAEATFAEQVGIAISSNPHLSGRKLRIETEDGRVVLLGTVSSYYQKQMAQEAVRRVEGLRGIDNRLTVSA
jgi:osmotically-inducible protein OsmY